MASSTCETALELADSLGPEEKLRLIQELTARVSAPPTTGKTGSILDLRGLGAEIWQGIDAQEYVNRERDS